MDQMEVRHQWRTHSCLAPFPDLILFPQSLSPKTSSSLHLASEKPCLRLCFQETKSKALMLKKKKKSWKVADSSDILGKGFLELVGPPQAFHHHPFSAGGFITWP